MKRIVVFVVFLFVMIVCFSNFTTTKNNVFATDGKSLIITTKNEQYSFQASESNDDYLIRTQYTNMSTAQKKQVANKMLKMGFDKQTILEYLFPSLKSVVEKIELDENVLYEDASVEALENCKINFKNGKNGLILDKKQLYNALFDKIDTDDTFQAKFNITTYKTGVEDIKPLFKQCSSFATNYSSSSDSRKNNIMLATKAINGTIIKPGEEFSFNKVTGPRGAKNGYMSAKIIIGGKYVDGYGGGVCQVSSTLYNAALLAGLQITESHPHSLPSSYVDAGFDAMVNMGSSDLKFINNTDNGYLITASANGNICKVVIYGVRPKLTPRKRNEKYEVILPKDDEIKIEYVEGLDAEYSDRISYASEGYRVRTYIDYYDGEKLVKTELVRDCKYNARSGLVVCYKNKSKNQT